MQLFTYYRWTLWKRWRINEHNSIGNITAYTHKRLPSLSIYESTSSCTHNVYNEGIVGQSCGFGRQRWISRRRSCYCDSIERSESCWFRRYRRRSTSSTSLSSRTGACHRTSCDVSPRTAANDRGRRWIHGRGEQGRYHPTHRRRWFDTERSAVSTAIGLAESGHRSRAWWWWWWQGMWSRRMRWKTQGCISNGLYGGSKWRWNRRGCTTQLTTSYRWSKRDPRSVFGTGSRVRRTQPTRFHQKITNRRIGCWWWRDTYDLCNAGRRGCTRISVRGTSVVEASIGMVCFSLDALCGYGCIGINYDCDTTHFPWSTLK